MCTNTRQGYTSYETYIKWKDAATQGKNRPDIYLTLKQEVLNQHM